MVDTFSNTEYFPSFKTLQLFNFKTFFYYFLTAKLHIWLILLKLSSLKTIQLFNSMYLAPYMVDTILKYVAFAFLQDHLAVQLQILSTCLLSGPFKKWISYMVDTFSNTEYFPSFKTLQLFNFKYSALTSFYYFLTAKLHTWLILLKLSSLKTIQLFNSMYLAPYMVDIFWNM